jgi:hypothetical protein
VGGFLEQVKRDPIVPTAQLHGVRIREQRILHRAPVGDGEAGEVGPRHRRDDGGSGNARCHLGESEVRRLR